MYRGALHSNISLAEVLPVCDEVEKTDGPGRKQKKEGRGGEKVVLITALFGAGSVKPFLPFFLKSMRQSGFDVMIISDQPIDPEMLRSSAGRVWHLNLSLSDLGQRVQTKIPECVVDLSQMTGYKIVDLRPLFGVLLEEELRNYSMWGHVDNDTLIGRVKHYLQKAGAFKGSIEVAPAQIVVNTFGPLTLYRNSCRINHLFRRSPVLCEMLCDPAPWAFDEWGHLLSKSQAERPPKSSMSAIVADAKQDRAFKLRVLSSQDMSMPLWDGERSFGHRTTCELRCPRNESAREPCKTMRAARGMKGGSEVPFCHFQYGKGRINEELEKLSAETVAQLLLNTSISVTPSTGLVQPAAIAAQRG